MKISAVKNAVTSFYDWIYNAAWTPAPANPALEAYGETFARNVKNATAMVLWAMLRTAFAVKEPLSVSTLRNFYDSLPDQKNDRDLTKQELFSLFEKFYFNEEALNASFYDKRILGLTPPLFQLPGFRFDLAQDFGRYKIIELEQLKKDGKFTEDNFNELLDRPNRVSAANTSLSTTALANAALEATGVTTAPAATLPAREKRKHGRDEFESFAKQSEFQAQAGSADHEEDLGQSREKRRRI